MNPIDNRKLYMVIIREAGKMTNQQAWDNLVNYSKNGNYGEYKANCPEIANIKLCMQVLDKCLDITSKTYSGSRWIRTYTVNAIKRAVTMISIEFIKRSSGDIVKIDSSGALSFVDLK